MSSSCTRNRAVGKSLLRTDVMDKLSGLARYVDDVEVPGCWHGVVVRSPVSHGRLRGFEFDPSFDWAQVVVAAADDVPGTNVLDMHDRVMPLIAFDEILYKGEPLAVVAAPTRELARAAAAKIRPDIEELPATLTLDELIEQFKTDSPDFFALCRQTIVKGDVEAGLAEADMVIEGEYRTGFQEQLYIEPQGLIAIPEEDGGVFIQGSMQCPYYIVHELHEALDLPPEKLRVAQTAVGGAFGGKEEYPSMLAGYCAVPAMKAGRPVKIVFDRNEDILYSTKRHPSWTRYRTGLKKDGTITAIHVDYLLNGGGYMTISDVVMYRGILHAAMGYRCDNVFVNGVVGRTNTFPCGAFRGFGAPQAIWGLESHIDGMAKACGMEPHEFRLKNCLHVGDTTPTGQVLRESVGSPAVLEKALEAADYRKKLGACSHGGGDGDTWYGIGLSFFAHGAGFTGDGEAKIKSRVAVDLDRDDEGQPKVYLRVSSTEMGQGSQTALSQIAADAMSVAFDSVRCPYPNTKVVPNSGPTVASRTTMVVGHTVHRACLDLKAKLEAAASSLLGVDVELRDGVFCGADGEYPFAEIAGRVLDREGALRGEHQFDLPPGIKWNQKTFEGDAYPAYAWGCNIAEVEVDRLTLEVTLKKVTACYDIGRVINPMMAEGQLEGGLTQAQGYALMEKMGLRNGQYDADRMQTYVVPTMLDTPEFDIHFVECPYAYAEPGAKGVGEIPMDGLAPAVAGAIEQALGVRITEIPILPEVLYEVLKDRLGGMQ